MTEHDVYSLLDGRKQRGKFTMLDNDVFQRKDLTIYEKMVYIVLCRFASSVSSECFPKRGTIAECAGCSIRQVSRAIESLLEKGLIILRSRRKGTSNVYVVNDVEGGACEAGVAEDMPVGHGGSASQAEEVCPSGRGGMPDRQEGCASQAHRTIRIEPDCIKSAAEQENEFTPEEATNDERECLKILKAIPGYPLDFLKDLKHLRNLAVDFPGIDILAELKKWRDWLLDHPLKRKRSNPRLGLRNWLGNAVKFNRQRGCPDSEKTDSDEVDPYEGVGV